MPKIISDEHYKRICCGIRERADAMYDMDTNEFWELYYDSDYEQEYVNNGYVGYDNDRDGTLFVDWFINHEILSEIDWFKDIPQD